MDTYNTNDERSTLIELPYHHQSSLSPLASSSSSSSLDGSTEEASTNSNDPFSSLILPFYDYFQRLSRVLSLKYLLFLGVIKFIICGIYASVIGSCFLPVFQRLGVDAATEQVLVLVCTIPYTVSPLIGILSDLLPIFGYHKKYYMFLSIVAGVIGSSILGAQDGALFSDTTMINEINDKPNTNTRATVVVCLVAMNLQLAVLNLLNEGKYSELMRENPEVAADIVTFQQACAALGSLLSISFVGPLSDTGNLQEIFMISLGLSLIPLVPTLLGWLPEPKRFIGDNGLYGCNCGKYSNILMLDYNRYIKQKHTICIATLVGFGGPLLTLVSAYFDQSLGIEIIAVVLLTVLVLSYVKLSPMIASVVAYTIITKASNPSMRSALQYFYTANETCLENGPHFSYTYYLTYNGLIGEIFMLVAIIVYQTYMTKWSYRTVLLTTLLLASGGRLVDIAIVNRWNIAMGIPDTIFFLLGSSMLESMTSMLYLLPFSAIVGKVCPSGTETTTFALIAGVSTYASTFSSLVGSSLMNLSGLKTTGEECDFSALPMLIASLSIVLPILLGIPAIYFLIPNILQSESFPDDDEQEEPLDHILLVEDDETETSSEDDHA